MLFLWIFGDNIEHRIGHLRFIAFYLVCGIAAGLAHIFFNSTSAIPTVGASGAISGVLGGYLLMFPQNRVYVLTWGGVATVPAVFMLGLWIVTQFVNGVGEIAAHSTRPAAWPTSRTSAASLPAWCSRRFSRRAAPRRAQA